MTSGQGLTSWGPAPTRACFSKAPASARFIQLFIQFYNIHHRIPFQMLRLVNHAQRQDPLLDRLAIGLVCRM